MKEQSSRIAWALSIQSVVATSASLIGCCLLFIITRNPVANTGTDTEKYFYVIYEGSIRVGLMAGGSDAAVQPDRGVRGGEGRRNQPTAV